jgi:hypothetical protein
VLTGCVTGSCAASGYSSTTVNGPAGSCPEPQDPPSLRVG